MKKTIIILAALVCSLVLQAASYGILVNGKTYYAGTKNQNPGDPSFEEYMVLGLSLTKDDYCQLYNRVSGDSWVVALDSYSTSDISKSDGKYIIGKTGCYDFYIKLKWEADQLYVGGNATCKDLQGEDLSAPTPTCPESYGLLIDGQYHAGTLNEKQTEWKEYMLRNVQLNKNQTIQLYDTCNKAAWVMDKFAPTSYEFPIQDGKYIVPEDGTYDFYLKFIYEADEVYIAKHGTYTTAVRDQCTDVLMQAFYNESYQVNNPTYGTDKYGDTKWATLLTQADSIGKWFDLVWLPPSANGDGMGYHPKNYSNQNSNWGTRAELEALIAALHNAGSKVVADIVINHCTGYSSWCDFPEFDFGEYGKFQPDASYICKNDEVNLNPDAGECYGAATGPYDDGDNWDGARDWAHDAPKVQAMFKAYLKWMRNVMKYDGFRYDKGDGFNNWHHDNYNKAAGPYIAFMESYNGDDKIIEGIEGANRNLMALDFQTRWALARTIPAWHYNECKGSGLLGRGYSRYAVTFIDSHDWFLRPDNENEFGGRGNSMNIKDRLMQANAFILSMPGLPCIFYPHWNKYSADLKPMIYARKLAGVHTESAVYDEEAEEGGYKCTVQGKYGWLRLQLGNKTNHSSCGDNAYQLIAKGDGYAIWVYREAPIETSISEQQTATVTRPEKFVKDGRLFIRCGEQVYDIFGNIIK